MLIFAYKPSHDGAVAVLADGRLVTCAEGEKDSGRRFSEVTTSQLVELMLSTNGKPDVIAESGWFGLPGNYFGWTGESAKCSFRRLLGMPIRHFTSSHERSHLMCAFGLSPFPQDQACYAIVWEGLLGSIYAIDPGGLVKRCLPILDGPGYRYAFAFFLADQGRQGHFCGDLDLAGKMTALASFAADRAPTTWETETLDRLLQMPVSDKAAVGMNLPIDKGIWSGTPYHDIGVETDQFKNLAGQLQRRLFDEFYSAAKGFVRERRPLLIAGGCGLNCGWNTRWRESGLFTDVFVPPCCNDSGSALGTAIDAQLYLTGSAKVEWSVDSGVDFVMDDTGLTGFQEVALSADELARWILGGAVVAWVKGRYEMGPRALGHRSILAEPFHRATRDRLNWIKQREPYRPIAPVCLDEDQAVFGLTEASPHMLYLATVRDTNLKAVTHVDGTARVQTVSDHSHPELAQVLRCVKAQTGLGVLCNTSLNFKGCGFINRLSHLASFVRSRGLDGMVVNCRAWRVTSKTAAPV